MENQPKKLYRTESDKIIAGVCSGIGQYFDIDPILVRGAFVLLGLINGAGLILYIVLAIIIPKEPISEIKNEDTKISTEEKIKTAAEDFKKDTQAFAGKFQNKSWVHDKRNIIGLIIIIIGLIALANQFMPHWFSWTLFWSLALVFIGFYIIIKR